jgi:hypothetical protein
MEDSPSSSNHGNQGNEDNHGYQDKCHLVILKQTKKVTMPFS